VYKLKVTVKKILSDCTDDSAMNPGEYFTLIDGARFLKAI